MLDVGVLDSQAPNVEVVADGDDDVNDKAAVNADSGTEHHEHEGHLVDVITEGAGPAISEVALEDGAHGVNDAKGNGQAEDVPVREAQVDKVGGNHLADAVGVDEAGEERKGDKMALADLGLKVEVGDDQSPDAEEGDEAKESTAGTVATGATGTDDVEGGLDRVEDEHNAALNEVPLSEGQVVDEGRNAKVRGHADGLEHALLPEVGTTDEASEDEDADDS